MTYTQAYRWAELKCKAGRKWYSLAARYFIGAETEESLDALAKLANRVMVA